MKAFFTAKNIRRLLVLGLLKKALILIFLLVMHMTTAEGLTVDVFQQLFPRVEHQEQALTFRINNCNVIAIQYSFGSSQDIPLIFVQHEQRSIAMETAKRLVGFLPAGSYEISPFANNAGSVAILCPFQSYSSQTIQALSLLYSPNASKRSIQFTGWQGTKLRCKVDLSKQPYDWMGETAYTSTGRHKSPKAVVEITLDITKRSVSCAEYRVVKGKLSDSEMIEFIKYRLGMTHAISSISTLTAKSKRELRSLYNNYELNFYSSTQNFCIASKGKVFCAGTLEGVKDALNNKREPIAFTFPDEHLPWPGKTNAAGTDDTANQSSNLASQDGTEDEDSDGSEYDPLPADVYVDNSHSYGYYAENYKIVPMHIQQVEGDGIITKDDFAAMFPKAIQKDNTYVLKLDNSRVIAIASPFRHNEVQLIIVTSNRDKEDARKTAQRLAKMLSENCILKPFNSSEPSIAILMPAVPSLNHHLDSPLHFLFYPRPGYEKNLSFINWDKGLLVARVNSNIPGAVGEVEITINPCENDNFNGVKLRVLQGKVDIQHFLAYGERTRGAAKRPDKETEAKLKKRLPCERVISYEQLTDSDEYCLLYMGDKTYFYGAVPKLEDRLSKPYSVPAINFPAVASEWPQEGNNNFTQRIRRSESREMSVNKELEMPTREEPERNLTPQQAYREFIDSLKKM